LQVSSGCSRAPPASTNEAQTLPLTSAVRLEVHDRVAGTPRGPLGTGERPPHPERDGAPPFCALGKPPDGDWDVDRDKRICRERVPAKGEDRRCRRSTS